jgi:ATP-binding cassette subfamily B (MDR/TAP) protein 1
VSKPSESAVAANDPDASKDVAAAPAPDLQVEYFKIFRYADTRDWALLAFGTFLACANGVTMPAFSLIFGDLLNSFNVPSDMLSVVSRYALNLVWIGLGTFFASWGSIAIFIGVGERQARRIREEYLRSILKQDMSWFDQHKAGELSTRLVADTELIQEGITQKAQAYVQFMSTFLAGVILGFVKGWQLTLVILAVTPLLAAAGGMFFLFFFPQHRFSTTIHLFPTLLV